MLHRRTVVALACLIVSCAPVDLGESRSPIIMGVRETGRPSVVAMYVMTPGATMGALCSGSVIGPHAVMTAKHCVFDETTGAMFAPANFTVILNDDVSHPSSFAFVGEIRTTPGSDVATDIMNGDDIAILLTTTRIGVPALTTATTAPAVGDVVTIVGYGRTRPGTPDPMDSGLKYSGTATVSGVGSHLIETNGVSATCQGDSGGPLFDTHGAVAGITSFGVDGRCYSPTSYYTRVSRHTALIAAALTWTPPCTPVAETCNGRDDNCNGVVDEGCSPTGASCTTSTECSGGTCATIDGAMRCSQACDPTALATGCPDATYCHETGCAMGWCLPTAVGAAGDGQPCMHDNDCASVHCGTVGGMRMCGRACNTAAGSAPCPGGELCDSSSATTGCGSCVPFAMSVVARPFGAPCDTNSQCESGQCADAGMPGAFCTQSCATATDCGTGFHCRTGTCVAGDLGGPGATCVSATDCATSAPDCVLVEGDRVCAPSCAGGAACPDGFTCAAADDGSMRCVLPGASLGTACTVSTECRSDLCAGGRCVRFCSSSSPCPTGFDCAPTTDPSTRVCYPAAAPPPMMHSSGGCSVGGGPGPAAPLALLAFALVATALRRRR